MKERGVEVLELHDLLAEILENREARDFILDRRVTANSVGPGTMGAVRPWLDEMPSKDLAEHLIGGFAIADLPDGDVKVLLEGAFGGTEFLLPPIPNTLFQT
jgi:arginine deiminase